MEKKFFEYHVNNDIPKLAWLVKIRKNSKKIEVICGNEVECHKTFFVAGTWDGVFANANFDISSVFWGSGVKLKDDNIIICTPSHALDRILSYEKKDYLYFSNSLPFLLAYENLNLDLYEDQYESILCSIIKGVNNYQKDIPIENSVIKQYIVCNIIVNDSLHIKECRRNKTAYFTSYEDYYTRLMDSLKEVKINSTSEDRKNIKFKLVSTISSGYDSSACACLAKQIGCDTVVTLSGDKYCLDDGSIIAKQLGYKNIISKDCDNFKHINNCIDAEYLCNGEMGTMLQFSVFEKEFKDSLVFYGARGSYWNRNFHITEDYCMTNYHLYETDISWSENALKNGYINIPLPTFGADSCLSIKKISNSKEMEPYMLNNNYDKPIPRRILESQGVDRLSFGQIKYGGGFYLGYDNLYSLRYKMSKMGYKSFIKSVYHTPINHLFRRLCKYSIYCIKIIPLIIIIVCNKLNLKVKHVTFAPLTTSNPFTSSQLFFWSMDVMKERYKKQLKLGEIKTNKDVI